MTGRASEVEAAAAACGRLGMGAAEIADALGWSAGELADGQRGWDELFAGRSRARDAALGWWEARARRWAGSGRPVGGLWGRVMAGRFGEAGYAPGARPSEPPEPLRRTRPITNRDRAMAVAALFAEAGYKLVPVEEADGRRQA